MEINCTPSIQGIEAEGVSPELCGILYYLRLAEGP
jgi:hypothetical protein